MKFVVLLLMITASSALNAANNKKVTFFAPVVVSGIRLEAGDYVVEWDGIDSEVQVTFWRENKKVATVPAAYRATSHPYDAVTVRPEKPGLNRLIEIDSRNSELRFREE